MKEAVNEPRVSDDVRELLDEAPAVRAAIDAARAAQQEMLERRLEEELARLGLAPEEAVKQGYTIQTTLHPECRGSGFRFGMDLKTGEASLAFCPCLHLARGAQMKCTVCGSQGFAPSETGRGCEFCDGTASGNPPPSPAPQGAAGMTEERLETALWIARALETHGDLHGAAPFLRELRMEVLRLRASTGGADAALPAHEQAFYLGAVWGHRQGREHYGPLTGTAIYDEYRRYFPARPPSPEGA